METVMEILSPFLQNHFGATYANELNPTFVINNYESAENILCNLEKFPKAKVDHLDRLVTELLPYYSLAKLGCSL
jgi:hypothetical protein